MRYYYHHRFLTMHVTVLQCFASTLRKVKPLRERFTVKKSFNQLFARKVLAGAIASASVIGMAALPLVAEAQQQSSAIVGSVSNPDGSPAADANVTIVDLRSGTTRTARTNESGNYSARNLSPGGPYEIRVNGVKQTTVQSISLGKAYQLPLVAGAGSIEEVIVRGQATTFSVAPGPSANFGIAELESAVAFDRDIKDVFAMDPRINVEGNNGAVNCTGKSPRFNTTTLDGVRYSDQFGLNDNGYGTATGMPFPFDAIEQVAVEIAPFDVKYTGFSACNINAVTKRGGNEWEGSLFYEYTDEGLRGDEVEGTSFDLEPYEEEFYGFAANGPIIEDTLFVSFAYEKQTFPRFLAQGFDGSGNGVERPWLSQEEFDRVRNIAQNYLQLRARWPAGRWRPGRRKVFRPRRLEYHQQSPGSLCLQLLRGLPGSRVG